MRHFRRSLNLRFTPWPSALLLVVAIACTLLPAPVLAQTNGFLVLSGIPNGRARVFVDGTERGVLVSTELTLELAPGQHTLHIEAAGFPHLEQIVAVRSGDVTYVPVVLDPSTVQLRVVHLEPARVDVRVDGQVVALTPATVTVPADETVIGVGDRMFCFVLTEGSDAYVRVLGGRIAEVRGGRSCSPDQGASFEAPHLPLSEVNFRRRRLWSRPRSGDRFDELWPLLSASFSHDGRLVLATLRGGQVIVWDNQTDAEVRRFRTRDDVWNAAFSPDGAQVLARLYSSGDQPRLLDSHTGAEDRRFELPDQIGPVAMGFDGKVLVVGSPFGYVALLDADTGAELMHFSTQEPGSVPGAELFRPTSVGISPDGMRVFGVIRETSEVVIWDARTGVEALRFSTNIDVEAAAFSPDGQFMLTATTASRRSDDPAEVVVWDAETGAEIQHFPTSTAVTMVAFSPDGRFLLASSFNELLVWTLFSEG